VIGTAGISGVGAAALLVLVLPPRLLPHSLPADIGIGAIALLLGYAATALAVATVRQIWLRKRFSTIRQPPSYALSSCIAALLTLAVMRTAIHLHRINERLGLPTTSATRHAVLAVTGATLVATAVLLLIAGLRRLSRRRLAVVICTPALVIGLASAHSGPPTASPKGAEFLAATREAGVTNVLNHRLTTQPSRIYVPLDAAASPIDRAALAVRETEQAGGFDHAAILIAVPTGSGWVNSRVVGTVEDLYHGDLTTVAVQYANSPSWQVFLRGGDGVRESATALVKAMRARIDQLPAGQRPTLLAYGESLGAWGLLPVLQSSAVDAALLTGVPGRQTIDVPRVTVFNHPDDPVPDWGPKLSPVAFLRTSADAISSEHAPVGHGHRYGAETAPAWCALLTSGTHPDQRLGLETPCRGD
jgi:uncharacterized membrane protein